jgi:hypothetical protein
MFGRSGMWQVNFGSTATITLGRTSRTRHRAIGRSSLRLWRSRKMILVMPSGFAQADSGEGSYDQRGRSLLNKFSPRQVQLNSGLPNGDDLLTQTLPFRGVFSNDRPKVLAGVARIGGAPCTPNSGSSAAIGNRDPGWPRPALHQLSLMSAPRQLNIELEKAS